MTRKFRSFSTPMSQKVVGLVNISIKKLRRPITARLVFLRRRSGKAKLLRRYDNGFLEEHEFSPSDRLRDRVRGCRDDLFSMVFTCKCLGGGLGSEIDDGIIGDEDDVTGDDVDRRAERFIERFYQEMRSQRRLSL